MNGEMMKSRNRENTRLKLKEVSLGMQENGTAKSGKKYGKKGKGDMMKSMDWIMLLRRGNMHG